MTEVLDGNAVAGALAEVFVPEMTAALTICGACGDARPVGELRAYLLLPGVVLRCATCEAVQLRLVRGPSRVWLDLRGVRALQVELPSVG